MSGIEGPPKGRKKEVMDTYDSISSDFDRTRNRPWPQTLDFVSKIPEKGFVLDIGCGNGKDTLLLLEQGYSTLSLDISINLCIISLRKARKFITEQQRKDQWFTIIQADCENLPFPDGIFDAALYLATLHHLPDEGSRTRSLKELKRCLREGGNALVSVWDYAQPRFKSSFERQMYSTDHKEDHEAFGDVVVPWKSIDGQVHERYYHLFLEEEFKSLLEGIGFRETRFFSESGNHFAEIIR
jgi:ubiquinone/menaquinone biosynthesis C-methylase UbiE